MNLRYPGIQVMHDSKPSQNSVRADYAGESKHVFALDSGTNLFRLHPQTWRLCDGL